MMKMAMEKDVASAIKQYRDLKASQPGNYDFGEPELNTLGYQLLQMRRAPEAIEIFKLNVEAYPQGFNAYDSLAEAYMMRGDKDLAIANYKKSLELNPQNTNAADKLKSLTTERREAKVDPKLYDAYAGDYELAPNFIMTITSQEGRLMSQITGQPKVELFPSSETEFFLKVVDAQVTFVKDAQGQVKGLVVHQGGRDHEAKKVK
jgi:tetratricopeptide (TPR) repeat protein